MFHALDHVILGVRDLDDAVRRVAQLLGRAPAWRGEHPAEGTGNALFRLSNTYVELLSPVGSGPTAEALRARLDSKGDGLVGLAFATDDAAACHEQLAAAGLEPGAVVPGIGRDIESGAWREWNRIPLPLARTRGVLLFGIEHRSPDGSLPPSGALGDEAAAVSGLDHAVVRTRDGDAARSLYAEGLGLRLALDREFPQWGARLLFFRVGDVTVEIAAELASPPSSPSSDGKPEANDDARTRDELWGLSYRVPDADAARARLAGLGFDVSEVRSGRRPGTRVFSVRGGTCNVPTLMLEPPRPG